MSQPLQKLRRLLNPLAALVDQAWLSLLSLAVSMAFIRGGSKEEFGFYVLMLAPLLLVQSVQNALVNSPLATFFPSAAKDEQPMLKQTAVGLHVLFALAAAVFGALCLSIYLHLNGRAFGFGLIAGFTVAILGAVAREAQRSFAYVQGKGASALKSDFLYGMVLLSGMAWVMMSQSITATAALWLTGLAGILPLLSRWRRHHTFRPGRHQMSQFWTCGRWALPSVLVTWINLSAYPFIAEKALGLAVVADIGASRIFLMPVGLVITAWSNWFRPRISRWFAAGEATKIRRLSFVSVGVGLACLALLGLTLVLGYPLFENLLGASYQGLLPLILMWLLFFSLSFCRNVFMATLMTDANGYKTLHHITWMALALSLPGFATTASFGPIWIIGVLCTAELLQLLIVGAKAAAYWKKGPVRP